MNFMLAFVILFLCLGGPSFAQDAQTTQKGPMTVSADQALEWQRADRQYIARGNVVITQDDMKLTADHVVADYRDGQKGGDSNTEIYRLTATGKVVTITTPTEIATGSKAVYDRDKNTAVLEGPVTITRGKTILNGAFATVDLTTKRSTLHGDPQSGGRVTGVFYTNEKQD